MTGLIGKKMGMTQYFGPDGSVVPVTVIQTGPCVIVQKKETSRDGYTALQLGFANKKPQRLNRAEQGHMRKAGKGGFQILREFRWADVTPYEIGQEIKASDIFKSGDLIDVTGTSKGRGFSGVIKRWRFAGFPASHGTHEYFRHGGSIGNRSFPGRVFKGKRMAGHWGDERVSVQNLKIIAVRDEENLLLVKGSVPGVSKGLVLIRPAVKGNH
ncbi:MAG: 50S ribosomal protein L3 [Deltaproteobacteria bacterium]|nr:50S ribosomal protein L3 [Deltaproteobacteria bacterium]